jgi:hypothetical protein
MPACVEKRQTRSFLAINLISLVTSDGKPAQKKARKCPRCQQTTLEYTPHVAVLSQSISQKKKKSADGPKDRLSYEPAWLCKNVACKYLQLIDN